MITFFGSNASKLWIIDLEFLFFFKLVEGLAFDFINDI